MKPPRRWKQFSLRSLLALTALVALALAAWVAYGEPWRREQRLIAHLAKNLNANAQLEPGGPAWLRWTVGVGRCRHLVNLELPGQLVRRQDVEMLAAAPRLRSLKIWPAPQLTSDDLAPLARLWQLEELDLNCPLLDDAGLKHLSGLRRLDKLTLTSPRITDAGLAHLSGLTELRDLRLSCSVTDRGMVHLKPLKKLRRLECFNIVPAPAAGRVPPEQAALAALDEKTDCDFKDLPLAVVMEYLSQRHGVPIQLSVLRGGTLTSLPPCTLKLSGKTLDEGLAAILGRTGLHWTLTAGGLSIVSQDRLRAARPHLAELRAALPQLKRVRVDWPLPPDSPGPQSPADRAVAELERLGARIVVGEALPEHRPVVRSVDLSMTEVDDSALAHLAALPELLDLDLSRTPLTDAGLLHLGSLARLMSLNLSDTLVDDFGIAKLASLQNLQTLDLSSTRVGDAGLTHIASLSRLRRLRLSDCQITDAGIADLLDKLPTLEVIKPDGERVSRRAPAP